MVGQVDVGAVLSREILVVVDVQRGGVVQRHRLGDAHVLHTHTYIHLHTYIHECGGTLNVRCGRMVKFYFVTES